MTLAVPTDLSEIDAAWLASNTSILDDSGINNVADLRITPVNDGMGQLSTRAIIEVSSTDSRTARFFLKLRAEAQGSHDYAISHRLYEREYLFYTTISPIKGVRTPKFYGGEYDPKTQTSCLVLEYVDNAHPANQIHGVNRDELHRAVKTLANMSATYWGNTAAIEWLPTVDSDILINTAHEMSQHHGEFVHRFGHVLSPERLCAVDRVIENFQDLILASQACEQTLCHWDFRVENLMFASHTDEVYVVDWQGVMTHSPGWDLAYLLGTNLLQKNLTQWFDESVDLYIRCLSEQGVQISRSELHYQIRLCLLTILQIPIVTGAQVDTGQPRVLDVLSCATDRLMFAMEWMDCEALLK